MTSNVQRPTSNVQGARCDVGRWTLDIGRTCGEALAWGTRYLRRCRIETARLDTEVLLAHCLGCTRPGLFGNRQGVLTPTQLRCFRELLGRRGTHEPLAYLTGCREFWSLPLTVHAGVLIPRPETEFVVEAALRYALSSRRPGRHCRILDLGTGSGNIAIAVATSLEGAAVVGLDISTAALEVAQVNAQAHGVAERITYIQSNLFRALNPRRVRFDMLLSNPPYIAASDWPSLPETVRCYEPREALDGGPDGLLFYRQLIGEAPQYMAVDGIAIVEVGHRQAGEVRWLFEHCQQWQVMEIIKDYSGIERVVVAQCTPKGAAPHGSHRD